MFPRSRTGGSPSAACTASDIQAAPSAACHDRARGRRAGRGPRSVPVAANRRTAARGRRSPAACPRVGGNRVGCGYPCDGVIRGPIAAGAPIARMPQVPISEKKNGPIGVGPMSADGRWSLHVLEWLQPRRPCLEREAPQTGNKHRRWRIGMLFRGSCKHGPLLRFRPSVRRCAASRPPPELQKSRGAKKKGRGEPLPVRSQGVLRSAVRTGRRGCGRKRRTGRS